MRKYLGAGLIVLGVVLTAYGLDASDSRNVRITQLFSGRPGDGRLSSAARFIDSLVLIGS